MLIESYVSHWLDWGHRDERQVLLTTVRQPAGGKKTRHVQEAAVHKCSQSAGEATILQFNAKQKNQPTREGILGYTPTKVNLRIIGKIKAFVKNKHDNFGASGL